MFVWRKVYQWEICAVCFMNTHTYRYSSWDNMWEQKNSKNNNNKFRSFFVPVLVFLFVCGTTKITYLLWVEIYTENGGSKGSFSLSVSCGSVIVWFGTIKSGGVDL